MTNYPANTCGILLTQQIPFQKRVFSSGRAALRGAPKRWFMFYYDKLALKRIICLRQSLLPRVALGGCCC